MHDASFICPCECINTSALCKLNGCECEVITISGIMKGPSRRGNTRKRREGREKRKKAEHQEKERKKKKGKID